MFEEVKKILQIDTNDTSHDSYLTVMIPILEEYVRDYCNNPFIQLVPGEYTYPKPVVLFIAKAIEYNAGETGLKSRSMGDVSYSYDLDFPPSLKRLLTPYRKLRFYASR